MQHGRPDNCRIRHLRRHLLIGQLLRDAAVGIGTRLTAVLAQAEHRVWVYDDGSPARNRQSDDRFEPRCADHRANLAGEPRRRIWSHPHYSAQIAIARRLWPDVVDDFKMLGRELEHCAAFRSAMPARHSRPCRVMSLWSWGGRLLGVVTAMAGRRSIWICTAAVEAAVHRHLDDQLYFLKERDAELHQIISAIREEELRHLDHAETQLAGAVSEHHPVRRLISVTTDVLIWLSTWGNSVRMARALQASHGAGSRAQREFQSLE